MHGGAKAREGENQMYIWEDPSELLLGRQESYKAVIIGWKILGSIHPILVFYLCTI